MSPTRREVLIQAKWFTAASTFGLPLVLALPQAQAASAAKPKNMQEWMDSWTGVKARDPIGGLYVYRFREPMWALTKPIAWRPSSDNSTLKRVDVPSGFVTDFASIPKAFYSVLRPDGEYAYAAIIHDYLYWIQDRSREECDKIFKECMLEFKVAETTAQVIFRAVRTFGGAAWKANKDHRLSGEKRLLIKLPTDPRITWDDWKKDKTVFAP